MKKILFLLSSIFLFQGCSSESPSNFEDFRESFSFEKPASNKITKSEKYSLSCSSLYYTNISFNLEGEVQSNISKGHENFIVYVEGDTVKLFGADFAVISDDSSYLILSRSYLASGLIETVTLNKETGFAVNSKTKGMDLSGNYPVGDTYLFSCSEI